MYVLRLYNSICKHSLLEKKSLKKEMDVFIFSIFLNMFNFL